VMMSLYALHDLAVLPCRCNLFRTALLLAGTMAIYTELTPLLVGILMVSLVGGMLLQTVTPLRGLIYLAVLPLLTLALNPAVLEDYYYIVMSRAVMPTTVENCLGFAYSPSGLGCLWVNEFWSSDAGPVGQLVLGFSVAMTGLALLGLGALACRCCALLTRSGRADAAYVRVCLLRLAILALALVPLPLLFKGHYVYQFLKLTLSVSPLLVLGVAQAWDWLPRPRLRAAVSGLSLTTLFLVSLTGTAALAYGSSKQNPPTPRSVQHMTLYKEWRMAHQKLASIQGEDLILACGSGIFHNGWAAYAARANNVWLVNPVLMENSVIAPVPEHCPKAPVCEGVVYNKAARRMHLSLAEQVVDLQNTPRKALLFTGTLQGQQVRIEGDHRLLWFTNHFQLWQLGPGPYTLHRTEASQLPN